MSHFECCHKCTDKRHIGCHGTCIDYKLARQSYDTDKAKELQEKKAQRVTFDWNISTRGSHIYNEV